MNGFGGRIKKLRRRVTGSLLVLSVAGSMVAVPSIAAAKPAPPTPPAQSQGSDHSGTTSTSTTSTTTDPPAGSITGHKVK